jgi:hypothetical protein
VNAGIVVTEPAEDSDFEKDFVSKPSVFAKPSDFVTSYDERYGWSAAPNSGRGSQGKRVAQSPPVPPPVVNTWTSIDAAKPQWEEQVNCPTSPTSNYPTRQKSTSRTNRKCLSDQTNKYFFIKQKGSLCLDTTKRCFLDI